MPFINIFAEANKNAVMKDAFGHMYPEPGRKYYGEMIIAVGEYGDEIIVKTDFPGLKSSPQRFEMEHSIFKSRGFAPGVYKVKCGIWFYKTSNDMYIGKPIGKLLSVKVEEIK